MKLFVWDFHGVLEKGNENAVFEISNLVLQESGHLQKFTLSDCHRLAGLKWFEYFQHLLPNQPPEVHLKLQEACFKKQTSNPEIVAKHIKPNKYAHEVLEAINTKHHQIVISNTKPRALTFFINLTNLNKYFNSNNTFAVDAHQAIPNNTKHKILSIFLRDKNYEDMVIVGDSPHDISLSSVSGGTTYLYAHPGRPHKNCDANYKINDLRKLLKEL